MDLITTVTAARPNSNSLRATVPKGIVHFLKLKEGNKLKWEMEFIDNKRIVVVSKV